MGLVCGSKIKDLIQAGFKFTVFLADWHSWINNKLGGDMEKIAICGEYIKQCFTALGVRPDRVEYLLASDIVNNTAYWERVIRIAKNTSLQRTWRALPIMGRELSMSEVETAWVFYPCMQVADIFHMDIDVACAGIDQRKAHMLAREVAEKLGWAKPSSVHTPLLMGLKGPETAERRFDENAALNLEISSKMSKSIPNSCIFVQDAPPVIEAKMRGAFCPPNEVRENPVLELAKYVVFPEKTGLKITRPPKFGGPVYFESYAALEKAYVMGTIHPLDLKNSITTALVDILKPVREYFQKRPQILEAMKKIEVTR